MKNSEYRFNPESLKYEEVKLTNLQVLTRLLGKSIRSLALAGLLAFTFYYLFDSPKEKALKLKNAELLSEYEILNAKLGTIDQVLNKLEKRDNNIYRAVFEKDPIDNTIRRAGSGGADMYSNLRHLDNADIVINTAKKLNELSKALYIQSKSYDQIEILVKEKEVMLASIPAIIPISIKNFERVSDAFGYRIHPIYKTKKFHSGMDFTGKINTPIYATGNGRVVKAQKQRGYGNMVIIDHGYNYKTVYAHLNKYIVKRGQRIKRGEIIGYLGNTGISTGPHLHYEVRKNNRAVDPINFYFTDLSADAYDRIVEAADNSGQSMD